jgi:hypothetical protein
MTDQRARVAIYHAFSLQRRSRTLQRDLPDSRKPGGERVPRLLLVCALLVCTGIAASDAHGAQGALTFSPASADFGNVNVGSSPTIAVVITNTGPVSVQITRESLRANIYSVSGITVPMSIPPGVHVTMTVKFAPTQAVLVTAYVTIGSDATNGWVRYRLSGTGVFTAAQTLTATPSSVSFGNVPVGTTNSQAIQLANSGTQSLSITSASVGGAQFTISGLATPLSLGAGQTASVTLQYTATGTSAANGSVTITTAGSAPPLVISESGTGIPATRTISTAPASLNFGTEEVGGALTLPVNITNTGNSSVTVAGISVTGIDAGAGGGLNGATIAPTQSATLNVTFAPKNAEQMSGNVTVTSNATNSPTLIALSGAGVAAVHSVALSWGESTSSGVAGYYVYRATAPSTSYAKLLTSPVSGLNYTDGSVASGATYLYVVTAVDARGVEGAYSGSASAVIP